MRYIRADILQVNSTSWRTYISEIDQFVSASSQSEAKEKTHRLVEETTGLKDFRMLWVPC